jgi:vacuolar-type H+-ATPase subunit H
VTPAATAPPSPSPESRLGSIDALKHVKATEADWELKLRAARGAAEEAIARLRTESEAAVAAAQAASDAERTRAVEAARAESEREAAEILAAGARVAEAAARGEGKRPADKKDAILSAVLAGFTKD